MRKLGFLVFGACLFTGCGNPPVSGEPAEAAKTSAPALPNGATKDSTPVSSAQTPSAQPVAQNDPSSRPSRPASTPSQQTKPQPKAPPKPEVKTASILGKWDVLNKLTNKTRTYEFRPDGTYILEAIDEAPDNKGTITVITTGTYKQNGKQISKHVVSILESTDDEPMKPAAEQDTKNFAKQVNNIAEYSGTIHWKDDDDAIIIANPGFDPLIEDQIQLKRHRD